MKKTLSLALAFALALTMTACSNNTGDTSPDVSDNASTSQGSASQRCV